MTGGSGGCSGASSSCGCAAIAAARNEEADEQVWEEWDCELGDHAKVGAVAQSAPGVGLELRLAGGRIGGRLRAAAGAA